MPPSFNLSQHRRSRALLLAGLTLIGGASAFAQTNDQKVHSSSPVLTVTSVPGASTEAVTFQGLATLRSRLALDSETRRPNLLVEVVWDGIKGESRSGSKFVMRGTEMLVLPVLAQQSIELNIPVAPEDSRKGAPQTSRVTLHLYFNTATGALLSASLSPLKTL